MKRNYCMRGFSSHSYIVKTSRRKIGDQNVVKKDRLSLSADIVIPNSDLVSICRVRNPKNRLLRTHPPTIVGCSL